LRSAEQLQNQLAAFAL